MQKEKIKSFITSKLGTSIITGVVCLFVGISIGGSSQAKDTTEANKSAVSSSAKKTESNSQKQLKTMNLNVDETINTNKGDYIVKIEGIRLTDKRNEFSEKKAKHVVLLDYSYANLSLEDELYVMDSHFKLIDDEGNVLDTYPVSDESRNAKEVPIGGKSKATATYCLETDSKNVKILYYSNMFNKPIRQITIATGL